MSILTTVFVATDEEAAAYNEQSFNERNDLQYEKAEFKNLTTLEFMALWAMLMDIEDDRELDEFGPVDVENSDGPWITRFPLSFVKVLRGAADAQIKQAAQAWSKLEELEGDWYTVEDLEQIIAEVAQLARKVEGEQGLYLWNCL